MQAGAGLRLLILLRCMVGNKNMQNTPNPSEHPSGSSPGSASGRPGDFVTLRAAHKPLLQIHFQIYDSPFGPVFIASSPQGITHILFDAEGSAKARVQKTHPEAELIAQGDAHHAAALSYFSNPAMPQHIWLAVSGTPFQLRVWQALLEVPLGQTSNYGALAQAIGKPKAARAIGGAVGKNPVSFIVPCHRILASDGGLGGYYWGTEMKQAMLNWEATRA